MTTVPRAPRLRLRPNVAVRQLVQNRSERAVSMSAVDLAVLHSTEGTNIPDSAQDLRGLGAFFNVRANEASSHVATDSDAQSARYVPDTEKAWTCAFFNSRSLNVEMIGRAAQRSWPDEQVWETARWLAAWHIRWGIPLRRGLVFGSRVVRTGVVTHRQLGRLGGGHVDPGMGFPVRKCIRYARRIVRERKEQRGR